MAFRRKLWPTRFGSFVRSYTIAGLMRGFQERGVGVTERTIYLWLQGKRWPRAEHHQAIEALSGGRITSADVLKHREEVRRDGGSGGRS